MRKMTYQQAATCGENLKVRVTPEQSEKLQKAWFAAGKTWAHDVFITPSIGQPLYIAVTR